MDFSDIVTFPNINKWFQQNKDKFKQLDNDYVGYKLNINRPAWFTNSNKCHQIESLVFTGDSHEEIFMKMYEKCLNTLVWKGGRNDGNPVDLMDYWQSYGEVLNELVEEEGNHYVIKPYYAFESDEEVNDSNDEISDTEYSAHESDEHENNSEDIDPEFNDIDPEFNEEENELIIKETNKQIYEPILFKYLIQDKLDFYGFTECGIYDCCFSVTGLEKV